jgi:hypothetical protein
MRPSCRIPLAICVAIFTIQVGIFSGVAARVGYAQATSTLPKSWNDAVTKLGDEVAAAMSPAAVTLSVNNVSSLDASYAGEVEAAVREQLQRHSFSFAPANTLAAQSAIPLQLTLSESAGEYVWVMQVPGDSADAKLIPTMIVSISKSDSMETEPDRQSLSLERRLVWKQPGKFLDFALLKDPLSGDSTLLILEANRLAVYHSAGSQWKLSHTIPIPRTASPSRDPQGAINGREGNFSVGGLKCVGTPNLAGSVQCEGVKPTPYPFKLITIPGLPTAVGTHVPGKCREKYISLYSGEGDWTQTDSIQGYLVKVMLAPAILSGYAIEFDGPVMSLQSEPDTSAARAVVRNLKTGEYEAYIVTATCGN